MPSFTTPRDVDAPNQSSSNIGGLSTLSTPVLLSTNNCVANVAHNLATPNAPAVAQYAGVAPVKTAAVTQPIDPTIL